MPGPALITTSGPLTTDQRIAGIHQPSRNGEVTKYTPFSKAYGHCPATTLPSALGIARRLVRWMRTP